MKDQNQKEEELIMKAIMKMLVIFDKERLRSVYQFVYKIWLICD